MLSREGCLPNCSCLLGVRVCLYLDCERQPDPFSVSAFERFLPSSCRMRSIVHSKVRGGASTEKRTGGELNLFYSQVVLCTYNSTGSIVHSISEDTVQSTVHRINPAQQLFSAAYSTSCTGKWHRSLLT